MNRLGTLAVAFVATFGLVVAGAAVAGFATSDGAAPAEEIENDHYLDENLVSDPTPGEADVTMSSAEPPRTVLIDPGTGGGAAAASPLALLGVGGAGVTERDIRPLANALIENGHEIRVSTPGAAPPQGPQGPQGPSQAPGVGPESALGAELDEADAFLTFGSGYSESEREDIEAFADDGGTVVSMADPDEEFGAPGSSALDSRLGVSNEPGYVYNLGENDLNYQRVYAEPASDSELTDGVDRVVFPTATPVGVTAGTDEFRPIEGTRLSTTRATTDRPLVVRNNNVIKIGNSAFLSPENAQRADNDVFIGNLADALVTSESGATVQQPAPEPSPDGGQPDANGGSEQPDTGGESDADGSESDT